MATKPPGQNREPDRLVEYLDSRLGSSFRSCVEYHPSGETTIHYLRPDIEPDTAESRVKRVDILTNAEREAKTAFPDDPAFGPLYASVHVFRTAIVVHLLDPDGAVLGVSLAPETGTDLSSFIQDCIKVLYVEPP